MVLKSLNCPNCGASVQIPEGVERFFCTYCGSQIQIDDGKITIDLNANINLNHQYTDVAKMRELELQEQQRIRAEKKERLSLEKSKEKVKKWRSTVLYSYLVLALLLVIGNSVTYIKADAIWLLGTPYMASFILPIVLSCQRPDNSYIDRKPIPNSKVALFFILWFGGLFFSMLLAALLLIPIYFLIKGRLI